MTGDSVVASSSSHTVDDGGVLILENPPLTAERQKRQGKKNLPKEAYQILKDYFFNVSQFPKKQERLELAEQVNRAAGSESGPYTAGNVQSYFGYMRKRHPQPSSVVVKRELVEEPLSFGGSELSTNGATLENNASSISAAPRKKRKSQATAVAQSAATISASASQYLSSASTNGSLSNMFLPPYAQSSASAPPATPTQKKRSRLKAQGYKVLHDFFNDVSRYPTAAQKEELLAAIAAIPGCEGYTNKRLTAFFSRMRMERKEEVAFVKAESPDLQMNAALHSATGQPSVSSSVPPPTSDALPALVPPASPLPVLQLAPSVPLPRRKPPPQSQPQPQSLRQPPTPTVSATQSSQFSVFSAYEPLLCTPQAPLHPHAHSNPQPTALAPLTVAGEGSADTPDPPRSSPDPPIVPAPIQDPSDPIPSPSPSPKSSKKPEWKPTKRALTDAALKILDDYYANTSSNPSQSQCAALASQISELPEDGRCTCTAKQVRKYFKRLRVDERCEALKEERMGAGADAQKPAMVLVAVVEPRTKTDESVQEESLPEMLNADVLEGRGASSSPLAQGGGDEQDSSRPVGDIAMGDVSEHLESEEVVSGSPQPDHDGERPEVHLEIPMEDERMDVEIQPDVEHAEHDSELAAEGEPSSDLKLDNSSVETNPAEDSAASSLPAPVDVDMDGGDDIVLGVSIDDVSENHEPKRIVTDSPYPVAPHECSNMHARISGGEDRTDPHLEAGLEQPQNDLEEVPEVEPESGRKRANSDVCEVVTDAVVQDPDEASVLRTLDGGGETSTNEAVPEVSMDDMPESPQSEDAESLQSSNGNTPKPGISMDLDSSPAPSIVQADVLALAAQLQRVFSRPPAMDAGHPTTFADFASWLEARNGNPVCASS